MRCSVFSCAVLLVVATTAGDLAAQQLPDRRTPEDKPRLVLNTGGHTNQVRALAFSSDAERLYSAGLDKIVLGWELRDRLKPVRRIRASLVQTIHWSMSRGLRGAIMEIATPAAGDSRLLAVGGFSAYGHGNDIALFDASTGQMHLALSELSNTLATGGLAFSPDGSRLAGISVFGDLWLWTIPDAPNRQDAASYQPRQLRPAESQDRPYRPLEFLDNDTLAAAIPVGEPGADQWGVAIFDVSQGRLQPRLLRHIHQGAITTIVRDPNSRRWATADKSGDVYLWNGVEEQNPQLLRRSREALDVAFGPQGSLFVATRLRPKADVAGVEAAFLEHWKIDPPQLVEEIDTSTSLDNYACAVSPDLKWLACCGDSRKPVLVFPLRDSNNQFLEKPLTQPGRQQLALLGVGQAMGKVAFANTRDGSYQIGFGPAEQSPGQSSQPLQFYNNYGSITQTFDLTKGRLLPDAQAPRSFVLPTANARGWKVTPVEKGRKLVLTNERGGYQCTITLDGANQGDGLSYCFLADRQRAYAIAVGTNHQNGIFVYQLVARGECPLLRYYRDHANVVTSLSVSPDGAYLASASLDQTIKLWSLDGLSSWDEIAAAQRSGFRKAVAWGAEFVTQGNRLVATEVKPAGIAFARGIRNGQVIHSILRVERGAVRKYETAAEMLDALNRSTVFEQLTINVLKDGQVVMLPAIVPAWEPVATLFVDRHGEWALFTPQGPYDASVNGDQRFGWQFNMGRDVTPEFYLAEKLRELEDPSRLRDLFAPGAGAMTVAQRIGDLVLQSRLARNVSLTAPQVKILEPKDAARFPDNPTVKIRVRVVYPPLGAGQDPASKYDVFATINSASIGKPLRRTRVSNNEEELLWETSQVVAYNKLIVSVSPKDASPKASFADASVSFRAVAPESLPRLHTLILAVDTYQNPFPLLFPVKDGDALMQDLTRYSAALYRPGKAYRLVNEDVSLSTTPQKIQEICDELSREAQPDDLLVVYIAGHGVGFQGEYFFVPAHEAIKKLDGNEEALIRKIAIPWETLLELRNVPCRKVVMLDTCHSGNAVLRESPAEQLKAAARPIRQSHMLVISATAENQFALEVKEEGVFTRCVRDGLKGQADGHTDEGANEGLRDGEVDVMELAHFVRREVPERTRTLSPQTPRQSPEDLFRTVDIPLAAYEFRPATNQQTGGRRPEAIAQRSSQ